MSLPRRAVLLAILALAACAKKPAPISAPDPAKTFLTANAKATGVRTTASGLQYRILRSGPATGLRPKLADEVKVNYEGKLVDGTVFDSSYERGQPAAMPLKGLVKAWLEVIPMMRPGDVWMIYVPPELGYGAEGQGPIPGGAALIFKIELIDFLPGPGSVAQG